jgi:hypothetical protein
MESGNGEEARSASSVDVCGLQQCPDPRNWMETFLATSSCPFTDPTASRDGGMIELESLLGFHVFFILRTKFELYGPVFIGVFTHMRRGLRDLTNLSLSRLQIMLDGEDSAWG